ncbi:uncharacterized protein LOC134062095 [Sardina pilchardus]|uniref:uncharacterized protein LOC134062095 n=1 Tax=Sardina pilchardus TaxID=27697 RepID=UPI002E11AB02
MPNKNPASSPQKQQEIVNKRFKASLPHEDIALLIKQTVETERETLREVVGSMLTVTLDKALSPLSACISENGALLRSLQDNIDCQAAKIETLTTKVDGLQGSVRQVKREANHCITELSKLQLKTDELEDRGRRNNIRIVNLPVGVEGEDAAGYLKTMLPVWIPDLAKTATLPLEIDRAHRVYTKSSQANTMIFRLLRYPDRQAILQGARKAKPPLPNGPKLEFYADYFAGTAQRRSAFKGLRARCRQMGIDTFLIYPAILRIKINV